jgi:hypothetical protein
MAILSRACIDLKCFDVSEIRLYNYAACLVGLAIKTAGTFRTPLDRKSRQEAFAEAFDEIGFRALPFRPIKIEETTFI